MPKAISMAVRQSIVERYKKGEGVSSLSSAFNVSRGSIYSFLNREGANGAVGLRPGYGNCGRPRPCADGFVYRAVRCMRAWHPEWGAEKIRAEMLLMRPGLGLPHCRTLNRWFHWNSQAETPPRSVLPKTGRRDAKHLHEGWQADAKEEMEVADGTMNCWLNITDEYSGTVIDPPVFPL